MEEIKKVTSKFPELINQEALEKHVRQKYKEYIYLEETVDEDRQNLMKREELLKQTKKYWESLEAVCDIEYEEKPLDENKFLNQEVNLAIINPSDRRNN